MMRYLFIMIALFSLSSLLLANDSSGQRTKMLLQGKHLTVRYEALKNRQEAWQERKLRLISEFIKKHDKDEDFVDDQFAKRRFEKRKHEVYASLQKRETEITKELSVVSKELKSLKVQFMHRYGVEMRREEIFGGKSPKVKNKRQKVLLLKEYVQADKSWKMCVEKVERFDKHRIELEVRTNISEKKYDSLSLRLDQKVEKNFADLSRYKTKSLDALDMYALDYGYSIPNLHAAKILLENILKSR